MIVILIITVFFISLRGRVHNGVIMVSPVTLVCIHIVCHVVCCSRCPAFLPETCPLSGRVNIDNKSILLTYPLIIVIIAVTGWKVGAVIFSILVVGI